MQNDLRELLEAWPYDSEESSSNFRKLKGKDGRAILQVREPLGIQQMEYDGRPDGFRPNGCATWLEYYSREASGDPSFSLSHDDCLALMQEGILFYQRYLVLYQMQDWEGVLRDTSRNLDYFDFARAHADDPRDSMTIEQYRPYLIRMNSIARGHLLWAEGEFDRAVELLREALLRIRALAPVETPVFQMEMQKAAKHLEDQIEQFEKRRPESPLDALKRRKIEAVLSEDFELAARLRDQIRALEGEFIGRN